MLGCMSGGQPLITPTPQSDLTRSYGVSIFPNKFLLASFHSASCSGWIGTTGAAGFFHYR
jgi:hypothetical protein